jgi:hypothetical protein
MYPTPIVCRQVPARAAGQRCQCTGCGQQFNRVTTFARHRVGDFGTLREPGARRCLSTEEMHGRGWRLNSAGFWLGAPMPAEALPQPVMQGGGGLRADAQDLLSWPRRRSRRSASI